MRLVDLTIAMTPEAWVERSVVGSPWRAVRQERPCRQKEIES